MAKEWVDFNELKKRVSMEMVLAHYGLLDKLKSSNKGLRGACPIHKGTHPNQFHVDPVKNRWNCFGGCDMKELEGHVIGFVAAMENVTLREAALKMAKWFNIDTTRPCQRQAEGPKTNSKPPKSPPQTPNATQPSDEPPAEPDQADDPENKELTFQLKSLSPKHPFFKERGILPETVEYFGLGFCTKGLMKDRIVFPLHRRDGALIGYTGRTVNEVTDENPKWLLPPGLIKAKVLLNFHRVVGKYRKVILVEGGTSLIAVHQADFPNVTGLLGREILEDENLSYDQLRLITENFHEAVLLLDGDPDGREAAQTSIQKLIQCIFVRLVILPDDKDPANFSPDQLKTILSFLK